MNLCDVLEKVLLVVSGIGLIIGVVQAIKAWTLLKKLTWDKVDKLTKSIIEEMKKNKYVPDVIVGVGRGGAIFGALLSGNIYREDIRINTVLLCVDRMYNWSNGRQVGNNNLVNFTPLVSKNVLLVASDVITGNTMLNFSEKLKAANVKDIKTACLIQTKVSTVNIDYVGKKVNTAFKMPWNY
jgi:probable phosphoglycerate mutase